MSDREKADVRAGRSNVRKSIETAITSVDHDRWCASAILTSPVADREGDIVCPSGLDFSLHAADPWLDLEHGETALGRRPVAWARRTLREPGSEYSLTWVQVPIAEKGGKREWLPVGTSYFDRDDPVSRAVFHLVASDTLPGVSLEFEPLIAEPLPEGGYRFKAARVRRWTHCAVPMNQYGYVLKSASIADEGLERICKAYRDGRVNGERIPPAVRKALAEIIEKKWPTSPTRTTIYEEGLPMEDDEIDDLLDDNTDPDADLAAAADEADDAASDDGMDDTAPDTTEDAAPDPMAEAVASAPADAAATGQPPTANASEPSLALAVGDETTTPTGTDAGATDAGATMDDAGGGTEAVGTDQPAEGSDAQDADDQPPNNGVAALLSHAQALIYAAQTLAEDIKVTDSPELFRHGTRIVDTVKELAERVMNIANRHDQRLTALKGDGEEPPAPEPDQPAELDEDGVLKHVRKVYKRYLLRQARRFRAKDFAPVVGPVKRETLKAKILRLKKTKPEEFRRYVLPRLLQLKKIKTQKGRKWTN